MDIDKVRFALEQNEMLTEEVKSNLFELTLIFNKHYPSISLLKLAERLETLQVEVISKFIKEEAVSYNEKTNTIQINETEVKKTNHTKHTLMVCLLHMISKTENDNHLLAGFRDGFATIIANNLVGSVEE